MLCLLSLWIINNARFTPAAQTMQTLEHTFIVLQCLGLWRPVHWHPGWKTKLYDSYTCLMGFLIVTVTLSEFIELMFSIDDVEAFANNSFMLLTMIGDCGKAANILIKRHQIIGLMTLLNHEPCRPINEKEYAIQRKFDRLVRSNTLRYAALTGITASTLVLRSFVEDIPRRTLPYKSWLPFNYNESSFCYTIAYSHQIVTLLAGAGVSIAFDTLVPGLMLQTCAQLNILKQRFYGIPQMLSIFKNENESSLIAPSYESKILSQRIKHHREIFKFAKTSNDLFGLTILLQYTVSSVVLCVSVYELAKMKLFSPEFTSLMMYLACMSAQIFIFCFYGNEVTFESLHVVDAIYEMDWTVLSKNGRRSLLLIMTRTLKPIKFTTLRIITLNLDSFKSLVKLSYSAYNVLQQSRE